MRKSVLQSVVQFTNDNADFLDRYFVAPVSVVIVGSLLIVYLAQH